MYSGRVGAVEDLTSVLVKRSRAAAHPPAAHLSFPLQIRLLSPCTPCSDPLAGGGGGRRGPLLRAPVKQRNEESERAKQEGEKLHGTPTVCSQTRARWRREYHAARESTHRLLHRCCSRRQEDVGAPPKPFYSGGE